MRPASPTPPGSPSRHNQENGSQPDASLCNPHLHTPAATLPCPYEKGLCGLYQLKRTFAKTRPGTQNTLDETSADLEWRIELMLYDCLQLGLEPALQALHTSRTFEEFEHWILAHHGGTLESSLITGINTRVHDAYRQSPAKTLANTFGSNHILSAAQIEQWQTSGYLVVPNMIDDTLCKKARDLVYRHLDMREDDPESWYVPTNKMQQIMVQLFDHPIQHEIRRSTKLRAVFEALWQTDALVMSTDRMGFNPPERPGWQFPGPNLHWDLDFSKPLAFSTQGLIYLTDVAANQGAFSCVPGFHRDMESWLQNQPREANIQHQDWNNWHVEPIAASAGSLVVWHSWLPHGASPNLAASPRIVQYINSYPIG